MALYATIDLVLHDVKVSLFEYKGAYTTYLEKLDIVL